MKIAYFPFTHISEQNARLLVSLVGPVVVYQPIKTAVVSALDELASQDLVEIRTPMAGDDDRLRAALTEFSEWARLNPGKSTAGADFVGSRQGEVPFFEETAINRIRSDIKRFGRSDAPEATIDDGFSARLFLALAQDNDLAVDGLDQDLDRFNTLENEFLNTLENADAAGFSRQGVGRRLWREDPGAKHTAQRLRAWARLVAADNRLPQVLVTTSPAVVEALIEDHAEAGGLKLLGEMRLRLTPGEAASVLGPVLAQLAAAESPASTDLAAFGLPTMDSVSGPGISVTIYGAAGMTPDRFIGGLTPATDIAKPPADQSTVVRHTLIMLVCS
jgi:hypothetical protein